MCHNSECRESVEPQASACIPPHGREALLSRPIRDTFLANVYSNLRLFSILNFNLMRASANRFVLSDDEVKQVMQFLPNSRSTKDLYRRFERSLKTRAERAREDGRKLGRPSTCTATREEVLVLRDKGMTWNEIAIELKVSLTKAYQLGNGGASGR